MEVVAFVMAVAAALVAGRYLFRFLFEDAEDFHECVRYAFTPNIVSMFRGDYANDVAKSFKLGLYLTLMTVAGILTHRGVSVA